MITNQKGKNGKTRRFNDDSCKINARFKQIRCKLWKVISIKRYNSGGTEQQAVARAVDEWRKQGHHHGGILNVASGDYITYEVWHNQGGSLGHLYEANDGSVTYGGGFKIA